MEIRCKKENCEYNTGCSCKAHSIAVDRAHSCCTYTPSPLKQNLIDQNGNIFEVAENKVQNHLRNVPLTCTARTCLFNKEEKCQANGISVIDGDQGEQEAGCATFCRG